MIVNISDKLGRVTAIRVHHIDSSAAITTGHEGNLRAVWGPGRRTIFCAGVCQIGRMAAIRVHHVDYSQFGSGPIRKSDPGAIWRPNRIFASDVTIRELSQVAAIRVDDVDGSDGTLTGGDLIADKNNLGAIRRPGWATIPRAVIG